MILRVLFGILMIFGAWSVLMFPAISSISICWAISFFMLLSGIMTIIHYFENKNAERVARKKGLPHLKTGIGSLLFGISAVVAALLARSSVIGELVFMRMISNLYGFWIVLNGVSYIVLGKELKKNAVSGWVTTMILGVLLIAAGIFCIIDCFTGLTSIGTVFGLSMMMTGYSYLFG